MECAKSVSLISGIIYSSLYENLLICMCTYIYTYTQRHTPSKYISQQRLHCKSVVKLLHVKNINVNLSVMQGQVPIMRRKITLFMFFISSSCCTLLKLANISLASQFNNLTNSWVMSCHVHPKCIVI